jgi:hypothetical protein
LLLYAYRENESLLVELEFLKIPYLFTSANLLKMLDVTPSVKTRLSMISAIGPRLIDPTAKAKELRELFRFSNDQDHVMSVLKQREKIQAASRFSKSIGKPGPGTSLGGRGGVGGRGAGGRGPFRPTSAAPVLAAEPGVPNRSRSAPAQIENTVVDDVDGDNVRRALSSFEPPRINTAISADAGDDGTTDAELLSEKSDGSPAEMASSCRSSDNGDLTRNESPHPHAAPAAKRPSITAGLICEDSTGSNGDGNAETGTGDIPARRKSSIVIKSRAVTVKTSTQINEEKKAAAAAALLEPKATPQTAAATTTPQVNKQSNGAKVLNSANQHAHFGTTKSVVGNGVNSFNNNNANNNASNAGQLERRPSTGRKILDSKGWMKKSESVDSGDYPKNVVDTPSTSMPSKVTVPLTLQQGTAGSGSVARTLFTGVDCAAENVGTVDGIALESKSPRDIVRNESNRHLGRTFSDQTIEGKQTMAEAQKEGPKSGVDPNRYAPRPPSGVPRRNGYSYQTDEAQVHSSVLPVAPLTGVLSVSELSRAYLSSTKKPGVAEVTRRATVAASPAATSCKGTSSSSQWAPWTPASDIRPRSNSMDQDELRKAVQKLTDPKMLANMQPEGSVAQDAQGNSLYTYIELVRRNITKSYGELIQTELENYMTDAEFLQKVGHTKVCGTVTIVEIATSLTYLMT